MSNLNIEDAYASSFSIRKIPVSQTENVFDIENDIYKDKIKILELSNIIDDWEQELLFSEKGFFSLKGKNVENKSNEFLSEFERFINSKISQMSFSSEKSVESAKQIKQIKFDRIKQQMLNYETQEMYEWEIQVYDKAIDCSIQKALSYKNNEKIVSSCLNNGLTVLTLMAEREKWTDKIIKSKKDNYISDFYSAIISAFLEEKNYKFVFYFEKYKNKLTKNKQEEFEKSTQKLKNNIIAYNWAKELFSYQLNDDENEKEIKSLNDEELEKSVRKFLEILKNSKTGAENRENKNNINKSWENIISIAKEEPEKALLYVDFNQKDTVVKSQKDYINKISLNGSVITDKSKYVQLFKEISADISKFKENSLSDYRNALSEDDYKFFIELQQESAEKLSFIVSDYDFLIKQLNQRKVNDDDSIYSILSLYVSALNLYKLQNNKDADLEKRNKIIEEILKRFLEENRKEKVKDDSIINNSGK